MKDHYKTLGIEPNATAEQIRKAYQKLALKFHPDKNVGNENAASENFKDIGEAYAVLGDPQQKAQYDRTRPKSKAESNPRTRKASAAPNSQKGLYQEFVDLIGENAFETIRPGHVGMSQRVENCLKDLIIRGLDIDSKYTSISDDYPKISLNILHMAIQKNKVDLVRFMLDRGVDLRVPFERVNPHSRNLEKVSSLGLAMNYLDDENLISKFITDNTNLTANLLNKFLETKKPVLISTTLNKAIEGGRLESIIVSDGTTALHRAVSYNYIEGINLLLNTGMNINAVSNSGDTALHVATREGKYEAVQELLKHGARVKLLNNKGESPLTLSVEQKDKISVDMVLMAAAQQGVLEDIVEFYIEDKSKTAAHAEIASRLTGGAPGILMQVAEYQKLTALSDLMQNPEALLPVVDCLRERKAANMQMNSNLPSRESSAAYSSSSGDKGKRYSALSIEEDFDLGMQEINKDDVREFWRSPGNHKRARAESPERK